MPPDVIPEHIKQFLLKNFDSIAQWEGLLLMRIKPGVEWNAPTIAENLYISVAEAVRLLSHLHDRGFLKPIKKTNHTFYHYAPLSKELEEAVNQTAELYKRYLIPITHIIHSKPQTRIREFADAFKLRKD